MWAIATRELRSFFLSPLAWSILGIIQFIVGLTFIANVSMFLQPNTQSALSQSPDAPGLTEFVVSDLFGLTGIILLLVTPLLTMRLISEERRQKTLSLLFSAPLSMTSIVLGKFLGLMGFFAIMLGLLTLMPLSLLMGGTLDFGQLAVSLLGLLLLMGAFTAIGLYMSTLTSHPTVAAISTFGILLFLWIIEWAGSSLGQGSLLNYLSIITHYQELLKGLLDSKDVAYYVLTIVLFLGLSIYRLDAERLQ
ncbi:ABC transporter permease [Candidatus Parabeggiatoa sp. HSG14]|uniref:ABC transporter permease n=1 Tax=Candidatus Parabeggiatoa sp. HSG14 TaxID=3055593 RepID=UPI0025A71F74|nr:ABC transporter permease [Thiotrichales bacterium HSG14]